MASRACNDPCRLRPNFYRVPNDLDYLCRRTWLIPSILRADCYCSNSLGLEYNSEACLYYVFQFVLRLPQFVFITMGEEEDEVSLYPWPSRGVAKEWSDEDGMGVERVGYLDS